MKLAREYSIQTEQSPLFDLKKCQSAPLPRKYEHGSRVKEWISRTINKQEGDEIDGILGPTKIRFFTPVVYDDKSELAKELHGYTGRVIEFLDNCFYFGGNKFIVRNAYSPNHGRGYIQYNGVESKKWIALKVAVLVIGTPILLPAKAIARSRIEYSSFDQDINLSI